MTPDRPSPDASGPVVIRPARPEDHAPVRDLLRACHLPDDDLDSASPAFTVAEHGGNLVGCAALEGRAGSQDLLFRSLAVAGPWRGRGLGVRLLEAVVANARARGVGGLWLLTTGAADWFLDHGFTPVDREGAPVAIRHTAQFTGLCPGSARLLYRPLEPCSGRLSADIRRLIDRCVLCWLATVDPEGGPTVSPKEIFEALGDDRLLIAHIASPGSVRNLEHNPRVCVSLVDVFVQKGWKLSGSARVIRPGEEPGRSVPSRTCTAANTNGSTIR